MTTSTASVIFYISVSQERTNILDSDLDFGSDKLAADVESLPSQDGNFVDNTDMYYESLFIRSHLFKFFVVVVIVVL